LAAVISLGVEGGEGSLEVGVAAAEEIDVVVVAQVECERQSSQ